MSWKPQREKWGWRKFLTLDEAKIIRASDDESAMVQKIQKQYAERWGRTRQLIVNRAIQRAKYAAR